MIDIAEHPNEPYIPLKSIAARQGISEKYLESILKILVQEHLLEGMRGKGGGYRLTMSPGEYTIGRILRLTETSLDLSAVLNLAQPPALRHLNAAQLVCG